MDGVGEVNGVPLFEYDVDTHDKPWKLPGTIITIISTFNIILNPIGADITDYFNYGFTEETWKLYCERQRQMKSEVGQLNKTVSGFAQAHLLVGPRTCSYNNSRLVSYYYNNNITLNYSAFIAVLMLNHIFLILLIITIATLAGHYLG